MFINISKTREDNIRTTTIAWVEEDYPSFRVYRHEESDGTTFTHSRAIGDIMRERAPGALYTAVGTYSHGLGCYRYRVTIRA